MIITARQARTANTYAPLQNRRAIGTATVRGLFGPSIKLWLHPNGAALASGTVVSAVNDYSNNNVTISQGTLSRRPIKSAVNNVPGFTFDGVDDFLSTTAVNLSGINKATVVIVNRLAVAGAAGILFEVGASAAIAGGIQIFRSSTAEFNANSYSFGSYNERKVASQANKWFCQVVTYDRALAAANENKLFIDGTNVVSTAVTIPDLSQNFENRASTIGGWSPSSATLKGQIAQLVVLRGALSAAQVFEISTALKQAAGSP